MTVPIKPLPAEVIHLIGAGEVIDSIGAVVRELVENAIDSGATRIAISLWPDLWRVQVADNGSGMTLANLRQAATAHSTSKIQHCEDLRQITSLGFRGEALHSLARLADLEIVSRIPSGEAWRAVYNQEGHPVQIEAAAIAPGTVVTVANLFQHWLPRRQGLPSSAQQLRTVQRLIGQMALSHPRVTWQVRRGDRNWFTISPGSTAQQILPQIAHNVRVEDLQHWFVELPNEGKDPVSQERDRVDSQSIELVLGLPDRCHRRRSDWVKVALNGRIVQAPELEQAILAAFVRTLPRDRYPLCFVHLRVVPEHIDWNRHPAKTEIYLHDLTQWQQRIASAIEQALRLSPTTTPNSDRHRMKQLIKVSEKPGAYHLRDDSKDEKPTLPQSLRAVAQVSNTYIVAEHPKGIWLVEQHIAHERVLYEQLCDRWQLVPLAPPIVLQHLSIQQLEQLRRLGLEVDPFGEQMWAVRNAPALLQERSDCAEALMELSLGGDLQGAQVATACRSAIRNGKPLTLSEMQTLLDGWQRTRHPRTCPHGRPIYLALEETALARFFRRHWVIGKSHGIIDN